MFIPPLHDHTQSIEFCDRNLHTPVAQIIHSIVYYVLPGKASSPCKQWLSAH